MASWLRQVRGGRTAGWPSHKRVVPYLERMRTVEEPSSNGGGMEGAKDEAKSANSFGSGSFGMMFAAKMKVKALQAKSRVVLNKREQQATLLSSAYNEYDLLFPEQTKIRARNLWVMRLKSSVLLAAKALKHLARARARIAERKERERLQKEQAEAKKEKETKKVARAMWGKLKNKYLDSNAVENLKRLFLSLNTAGEDLEDITSSISDLIASIMGDVTNMQALLASVHELVEDKTTSIMAAKVLLQLAAENPGMMGGRLEALLETAHDQGLITPEEEADLLEGARIVAEDTEATAEEATLLEEEEDAEEEVAALYGAARLRSNSAGGFERRRTRDESGAWILADESTAPGLAIRLQRTLAAYFPGGQPPPDWSSVSLADLPEGARELLTVLGRGSGRSADEVLEYLREAGGGFEAALGKLVIESWPALAGELGAELDGALAAAADQHCKDGRMVRGAAGATAVAGAESTALRGGKEALVERVARLRRESCRQGDEDPPLAPPGPGTFLEDSDDDDYPSSSST
eukprot:CAMPEP_0182882836 /NCGR_PEP_ID=MMETSP0034_2-20130328/18022_1 /TAXON_ID=156128 /ORGANISM="Nephroselmis pyriformis, Strain CCMP717" /LENGTH=522 /DNA_ID=CAMNT_0025015949 /DNA_START=67 /DNA_END=1633 /DNA_ORIENTATION=+